MVENRNAKLKYKTQLCRNMFAQPTMQLGGIIQSEISTTYRRCNYHLCLEACGQINSADAPFNRDDGGLLPDTILHLVNNNKCSLVSV